MVAKIYCMNILELLKCSVRDSLIIYLMENIFNLLLIGEHVGWNEKSVL